MNFPSTLPAGFTIVRHPKTKVRFVSLPGGRGLIPNQGESGLPIGLPQALEATDEQLVHNCWVFLNKPHGRKFAPKGAL